MNLHIDELLQGFLDEQQFINKHGSAVFDQTHNGAMFPTADKQSLWQFSKGDKHLRLSNGTNVFHFNVDHHNADNEEMDLSRGPDVPLPDLFTNSSSKGKAQVHRSDPSSIYFTLQEGTKNPTYTIRHIGGDKWKALPKRKTVKQQMNNPAPIPNINVESLKTAMMDEAGGHNKQADWSSFIQDLIARFPILAKLFGSSAAGAPPPSPDLINDDPNAVAPPAAPAPVTAAPAAPAPVTAAPAAPAPVTAAPAPAPAPVTAAPAAPAPVTAAPVPNSTVMPADLAAIEKQVVARGTPAPNAFRGANGQVDVAASKKMLANMSTEDLLAASQRSRMDDVGGRTDVQLDPKASLAPGQVFTAQAAGKPIIPPQVKKGSVTAADIDREAGTVAKDFFPNRPESASR